MHNLLNAASEYSLVYIYILSVSSNLRKSASKLFIIVFAPCLHPLDIPPGLPPGYVSEGIYTWHL